MCRFVSNKKIENNRAGADKKNAGKMQITSPSLSPESFE